MDAADLRVFESVARLGGMSRAAAELNTVQSNVTARVRQLEDELGVVLFQRTSRGVTLTAEGERLLPYATRVAHLLDEARRVVRDDGNPRGALTIGSLETTAARRLAPVVATFGSAYPEVCLTLKTGTNAMLVEDVVQYRVDGAFICGPIRHPELEGDVVFREELVFATAPNIRSIDDFLSKEGCKILVKGQGCAYRERCEDLLVNRGVTNISRLEFGTLEAIIGCVEVNLGITLLPRSVLENAARNGRIALHPIPPADARVAIPLVRRRDVVPSSAYKAFLEAAVRTSLAVVAAE